MAKISKIYLCYLLKQDKGSEWLLGENTMNLLKSNEYIICAAHQLKHLKEINFINKIPVLRKNKKIVAVGIFGKKK